jgi:hypothetical protein
VECHIICIFNHLSTMFEENYPWLEYCSDVLLFQIDRFDFSCCIFMKPLFWRKLSFPLRHLFGGIVMPLRGHLGIINPCLSLEAVPASW